MKRSTLALYLLPLLGSCRTVDSGSDAKVVNGTEIAETEFPATVSVQDDFFKRPFCSGTWISKTTLLTAAHCLNSHGNLLEVRVGGVRPNFILAKKDGGDSADNDQAVMIFGKDMAPAVAPLAPAVSAGSPFTIVGYGCTAKETSDGVGIKRKGAGTVREVLPNGVITADAQTPNATPGAVSDACEGDSGGALMIDGKLAGIVSRGDSSTTRYTGVNTPWARFLFGQAVAFGATIPGVAAASEIDVADLDVWDERRFDDLMTTLAEQLIPVKAAYQKKISELVASGGKKTDVMMFFERTDHGLKTRPYWLTKQYVASPICSALSDGNFACRLPSVEGVPDNVPLAELPGVLAAKGYNAAVWARLMPVGDPPDLVALSGKARIEVHLFYRDGTHQVF